MSNGVCCKKCIASGTILRELDKESGKLVKEIVATVYAEYVCTDDSNCMCSCEDESGCCSEGMKSVVLKYKNFKCEEDIAAPLSYEDIAAEGGEMTVPGIGGHADVALEAPVVVKYSKTRTYEFEGNTVVSASIRYKM